VAKWLRRRQFVVDSKLQFSVLLITLGYVGFLLLVVSLSLFGPLVFKLRNVGLEPPSDEVVSAALAILYLHQRFWLTILLALVVIVLHSLRTTHRIAGPLYRFRRVFESVTRGVFPKPAKLRKGDYLTPEMEVINRMVTTLGGRIGQAQREAERLHQSLAAYRKQTGPAGPGATTDAAWDEIIRADSELSDALGWFRTEE
jgi:hypothetical protein